MLYPPDARAGSLVPHPAARPSARTASSTADRTAIRLLSVRSARPASADGRRAAGRVVGSGSAFARYRGAGAASASAHSRGRLQGCRGGQRGKLRRVEDGTRGAARPRLQPSMSVQTVTSLARTKAAEASESESGYRRTARRHCGGLRRTFMSRSWSVVTRSGQAADASAPLSTPYWHLSTSTPVPMRFMRWLRVMEGSLVRRRRRSKLPSYRRHRARASDPTNGCSKRG